ncbi:MAG: sigma-70 family RNA polymerase sigma factor [Crocinitomicaceae bacterium]|nr:sigma-70 family RNA polymerase sigma factor [Crocinitomicaceae bacterium]
MKNLLEQWVDEYSDFLYNLAYYKLYDEDLANDFVQETFISILKNEENLDSIGNPKSYLATILSRKVIDHWRKKEVKTTSNFSSFFHQDGKQEGHWKADAMSKNDLNFLENELDNKELREIIMECFEALPENQRIIASEKLLNDRDTDEICNEYGVSSSNLWVIIHRAKVRLRACIENKWYKDESM